MAGMVLLKTLGPNHMFTYVLKVYNISLQSRYFCATAHQRWAKKLPKLVMFFSSIYKGAFSRWCSSSSNRNKSGSIVIIDQSMKQLVKN